MNNTSNVNPDIHELLNIPAIFKLRKFLKSLIEFSHSISPFTLERVISLSHSLLTMNITIDDFHEKIQQTTNFPLRSFVIPFLKEALPLLHREITSYAVNSNLSTTAVLKSFEDSFTLPVFSTDAVPAKRTSDSCPRNVSASKRLASGDSPFCTSLFFINGSRSLNDSVDLDYDDDIKTLEKTLDNMEDMVSNCRRVINVMKIKSSCSKCCSNTDLRSFQINKNDIIEEVRRKVLKDVEALIAQENHSHMMALARLQSDFDKFAGRCKFDKQQSNFEQRCWNCGKNPNTNCVKCGANLYCEKPCEQNWESGRNDTSPEKQTIVKEEVIQIET